MHFEGKLLALKGGAKKGAKRLPQQSKPKRRNTERDDYDEDDGEEDDDPMMSRPRHSRVKSHGKPKPRQTNEKHKKMQLVQWGNRGQEKHRGFGIRERLEELAKHGQAAYKDAYRRAKVF